ncbi:cellulose synthase complex periplasmic endoglucanase BcsZ [Leptothrix cholodnii]|nr:cellulose synthase complex periplasmic endoglucanase BcsZ [Leptothrix cholodnii]
MLRRRVLGALAFGLPMATRAQSANPCSAVEGPTGWPAWQTLRRTLMSRDGRVIDRYASDATTSEGQAYGLFFALVDNDRAAFELLLRWTEDNLAAGDLAARLPAWRWGRRADGSWNVIDANSAADADLWLSYVLSEAGRLWKNRRYDALGRVLARRIAAEEVIELPGLGTTLLPGPQGFRRGERGAKLNPSYLPPQLLRWFARNRTESVWVPLRDASLRLLHDSAPHGLAPDWTVFDADRGWSLAELADDERSGSYNAIRVYLWLGLTDPGDPARGRLLARYAPMARLSELLGGVPEKVDPARPALEQSAGAQANGPVGFQAAMLPFADALGQTALSERLADRVATQGVQPDAYYDQVLSLFALGFRERRYRFAADGSLQPGWASCDAPPGSSR